MYVVLSSGEPESIVSLEEPDDCTRFHVVICGIPEDAVRQALTHNDMGWLSNRDSAWIKIAVLRRLAQGRVAPDWPERFDEMQRYAEHKGWLDDDRATVSAHCEWS